MAINQKGQYMFTKKKIFLFILILLALMVFSLVAVRHYFISLSMQTVILNPSDRFIANIGLSKANIEAYEYDEETYGCGYDECVLFVVSQPDKQVYDGYYMIIEYENYEPQSSFLVWEGTFSGIVDKSELGITVYKSMLVGPKGFITSVEGEICDNTCEFNIGKEFYDEALEESNNAPIKPLLHDTRLIVKW